MGKSHSRKIDPAIETDLQELGRIIGNNTPEGVVFSTWFFDTRNQDEEGGAKLYLVTSVEREQVMVHLLQWLAVQLDHAVLLPKVTHSKKEREGIAMLPDAIKWAAKLLAKANFTLPPPSAQYRHVDMRDQEGDETDGREIRD